MLKHTYSTNSEWNMDRCCVAQRIQCIHKCVMFPGLSRVMIQNHILVIVTSIEVYRDFTARGVEYCPKKEGKKERKKDSSNTRFSQRRDDLNNMPLNSSTTNDIQHHNQVWVPAEHNLQPVVKAAPNSLATQISASSEQTHTQLAGHTSKMLKAVGWLEYIVYLLRMIAPLWDWKNLELHGWAYGFQPGRHCLLPPPLFFLSLSNAFPWCVLHSVEIVCTQREPCLYT